MEAPANHYICGGFFLYALFLVKKKCTWTENIM
jgi:hypothetical protein